MSWPLPDNVTTNIVVYDKQKGGRVGGGYCAIIVQKYCNSVGDTGREGSVRIINS